MNKLLRLQGVPHFMSAIGAAHLVNYDQASELNIDDSVTGLQTQ